MDWVLLRNQWSQKYVSAVNGKPIQAKLSKGPGIINNTIHTLTSMNLLAQYLPLGG